MRPGATPFSTHTTFSVWAPRAHRVDVQLQTGGKVELSRVEAGPEARDGVFHGDAGCGPGTQYRYVLDGVLERADPASSFQPAGVHGPSEVVDLQSHRWHDAGFRPVPLRDAVLYELHIGTCTPGGTFASAIEPLDDLARLGVTAIEIMPVAQFPGRRNWGYDGVFPFAVQNSYGGPHGLQQFVDECHQRGLAVVLDVVYNHFGPEGNVLPDFAPYLTDRYNTPWGPAVNLDGPGSDGVRSFFIANALRWFEDFHIDGLRLDAVHEFVDRSARPFLAHLSDAVQDYAERTGRTAWLIAESADNDPRLVSPPALGGVGMDAQWNDDFHHALHTALTSENTGYYRDYVGTTDLARAMDMGFVFQGQYSAFRNRHHGASSVGIDPSRFVVFDQNHDQVGNRADGSRLASLVPPERLRLAAALVALAPGVPLLFMGEEYAATAPFAYFVDHGDPELLDAVRHGRAREFGRNAGDVLDPGDEKTFLRCVLDPALRHESARADAMWEHWRTLLALRAAEPALRRADRADTTAKTDAVVLTLTRYHEGVTVVALFNLSSTDAAGVLPALSSGLGWEELLDESPNSPAAAHVALAPWAFRVYRSVPAPLAS